MYKVIQLTITFIPKTLYWKLDVSKKFKIRRAVKSLILIGKIQGKDGSKFRRRL